MSGDASLHFRGGHLHQGGHAALHAPHLRIDTAAVDFADCRALADAVALRLRYTDKVLHEALRPADGIERLVFEWLEQMRVETLVDAALPGRRTTCATASSAGRATTTAPG
jgi:cobaltochelatase CobT